MAHPPLILRSTSEEERAELPGRLYRRTSMPRLRTRAQIILLALEQGMIASEIAPLVRSSEQTVRNWTGAFQR